jgi:hypothetical protein
LDPQLLSAEDHDLWLLDAHGNPTRLPGSESGRLHATARASLLAAARDRMPGTAEAEDALDRLLPRPDESLIEAAEDWWGELLGEHVDLLRLDLQEAPSDVAWLDRDAIPELLWVGPRHQRAMQELAVPIEIVLQGEAALKDELAGRHRGQIGSLAKQLDRQLDKGLAQLKAAIEAESPGMLGSWSRFRRAARKASAEFRRASDRFERNRRGIRGNRLHALAQGLRPHDGRQEDYLGLVCAMALFRLDPRAAVVEHEKVFHDTHAQPPNLVLIGAGISASGSLS